MLRNEIFKRALALAAVSLPVGFSIPVSVAQAGVVNSYDVRMTACQAAPIVESDLTTEADYSFTNSVGNLGCAADVAAQIGPGFLGVKHFSSTFSSLNSDPNPFSGFAPTNQSALRSTVNNIFITPNGATDPQSEIDLRINFDFDATGIASSVAGGFNSGFSASADTSFEVQVVGETATGDRSSWTGGRSNGTNSFVSFGVGTTRGFEETVQLKSDELTIDISKPISISFYLEGRAISQASNGAVSFADLDAFNTLSFANSGPVFDLPEGYTVNSVSAGIVNNRWIDPRPSQPQVSTVPLPAGGLLFLSAFGVLWGLSRKRTP